jgi:translation initiation factor eIF-2B subunit delta
MDQVNRAEIEAIESDTHAGATTLLSRGIGILQRAAASRPRLEETAGALVRAQPSMAGFRTAAAIALSAPDPILALSKLAARVERAPSTIARHACSVLMLEPGPMRLVTVSRSLAVEQTLLAIHRLRPLVVCCGEARPALEGRALAEALAAHGVRVELFSDAGLGATVPSAQAVIVGADAIGPREFINKAGTAGICALASAVGVPAYVLSGREKIVSEEVFVDLAIRTGPQSEIWFQSSPFITVRNSYYDRTPLSWMAAVVTDGGILVTDEVMAARLI